jgi:hypothetical protein
MPSIEELTVEEQFRLAEAAGALPVGLRPSEVRQRRGGSSNRKTPAEPLIKDIPSLPDNVTIHQVPLDEFATEQEGDESDAEGEMPLRRHYVEEEEVPVDFADEIFNMVMYLIPYSTLFLMLDM